MTPLSHVTGCRWPIDHEGAVWFCDAPKVRGSYCGPCAERAYAGFRWGRMPDYRSSARIETMAVYVTRSERLDAYAAKIRGPQAARVVTGWDDGRHSK